MECADSSPNSSRGSRPATARSREPSRQAKQLVVVVEFEATPHGSETSLKRSYGQVMTFEDGLVGRTTMYYTPEEAFEAVGLRE